MECLAWAGERHNQCLNHQQPCLQLSDAWYWYVAAMSPGLESLGNHCQSHTDYGTWGQGTSTGHDQGPERLHHLHLWQQHQVADVNGQCYLVHLVLQM